MTHKTAVFELMKTFSLTPGDFLNDTLNQKISRTINDMRRQVGEAQLTNDQKNVKYRAGMLSNSKNMAAFCKKIFSVTPSFIDIIANYEWNEMTNSWEKAMANSEIQKSDRNYQICADVRYPVHSLPDIQPDEVPVFYERIREIVIDS